MKIKRCIQFFIILFTFSLNLFATSSPWVKVEDVNHLPYFGQINQQEKEELLIAVKESLVYLNRKSAKYHYPKQHITHEKVLKSLQRFEELLKSDLTGDAFDQKIKEEFDCYKSKGRSDKKGVLFTGYYEPLYHGSLKCEGKYQYPLYKTPLDIVFDKKQKVLGRRDENGLLVTRYWTRQDIDVKKVLKNKNLELVYLDNPYDVYQAQFQGSVAVQLSNGEIKRYGYSARNCSTVGFSLANELLHEGKLTKKELLPSIVANYFYEKPHELDHYLKKNPSYVFFTERKKGPLGSLSVFLQGGRAISTDSRLFPKAALAFVDLKLYKDKKNHPFQHFVLNQDTGGAIIGPGRCDIFFGTGDKAKELASDMFSVGQLYFLFLKD